MRTFLYFIIVVLCFMSYSIKAKKLRKERAIDYYKIITSIPKAKLIFQDIYDLWNVFLTQPNSTIQNALFQNREQQITDGFAQILPKLLDLEQEVGNTANTIIDGILEAFPKIIRLELDLHELRKIINQINFAYEQMRNYIVLGYNVTSEKLNITKSDTEFLLIENQNESLKYDYRNVEKISNNFTISEMGLKGAVERFTLENFATWMAGHDYNSLQSLLRRMNDLVAPNNNVGIFKIIQETSQEAQIHICNLKESPHQLLYHMYNTIAIAELKANSMLQFSYMILRIFHKGNFEKEADLAMSNHENYARRKLKILHDVLPEADRSVYRCDPKRSLENVTFTRVTNLLRGYIENEVNLNPDGTCFNDCKYYSHTEYYGCFKNKFCSVQPKCNGKIINCQYVHSDMNICVSSNPLRRYDWVEYKNEKILGKKDFCPKNQLYEVNSWWRYIFVHCTYCLCLCDEGDEESDRFFNLRKVTSDIELNKIVTGVRIVKHNRIIHIQIQQGILLSRGLIDRNSLSWKPVDNYSIESENVVEGLDYHSMNWMERAIDLDDVAGPPEHVVTGVRFRTIGSHLNLEIRVTPVNFTTGKVFTASHSYWMGNDNTAVSKNPRAEIKLTEPNIPTSGPHVLYSQSNEYIQFQPTSFTKDLGQTTVPFLDTQAITSEGYPLSGIGLIYRGKPGSGGFIAPKLISYDFEPHLHFY